jgi:hypothetical protein
MIEDIPSAFSFLSVFRIPVSKAPASPKITLDLPPFPIRIIVKAKKGISTCPPLVSEPPPGARAVERSKERLPELPPERRLK